MANEPIHYKNHSFLLLSSEEKLMLTGLYRERSVPVYICLKCGYLRSNYTNSQFYCHEQMGSIPDDSDWQEFPTKSNIPSLESLLISEE